MGLLDYLGNLFGPSQGPAALLPQQQSPSQQKWMDALGGFSAALKDAGAYLQHRPEAAGNVTAFDAARQKQMQNATSRANYNRVLLGLLSGAQPPSPQNGDNASAVVAPRNVAIPSILHTLPPEIAIPLILMHAQMQAPNAVPANLPNGEPMANQP